MSEISFVKLFALAAFGKLAAHQPHDDLAGGVPFGGFCVGSESLEDCSGGSLGFRPW